MLARIEPVDYEDTLEDSDAQLVSARSELANAERQRELATRESLVPLAVSLAFGILAAAVAALLMVPALWLSVAGLRRAES